MIPVAEAQARILAHARLAGTEWLPLERAAGRVLAADVVARYDQPPAAVSSMDGYAVRSADAALAGAVLDVIGRAQAGHRFDGRVGPGGAVRVFTGAAVPEGADAVALQEDVVVEGQRIRLGEAVRAGQFVRPAGLDFKRGEVGPGAGTVLDALSLGLAAAMGHGHVLVRRRPRVGILATGDELVRAGQLPEPTQIVASSSPMLAAMIRAWGGEPVDLGIAPDDLAGLDSGLADAAGLDLLVTTGGASVGEHDLVQTAAGARGLELDFWKVAIRPGKPLIVGRIGATTLLGLPGNPVSSAVCAIVFLRGLIRACLGLDPTLPVGKARLAEPLPANDRREDYLRARRVAGPAPDAWLHCAARQDSSMLATLARAEALVIRPPLAAAAAAGEAVPVIWLSEVVMDNRA
jgi:molybdopterin molybdotransferase